MKTTTEILTVYIGDMLAAQNHLLKMVDHQLADSQVTTYAQIQEFLPPLRSALRRHAIDLEQRLSELGGSISANVKEAITAATGIAAGLFGRVRPHVASKFLRDDYVVLSGCSIGYEMLHATALALRDKKTADLALEHFKEITPMIVRLSEIIPAIIVHELTHDIAGVDAGAALVARTNTQHAWSGEHVHSHG